MNFQNDGDPDSPSKALMSTWVALSPAKNWWPFKTFSKASRPISEANSSFEGNGAYVASFLWLLAYEEMKKSICNSLLDKCK